MKEVWVPVPSLAGKYEVSDKGQLRHTSDKRLARPSRNGRGVQYSVRRPDGKYGAARAHILVLTSFVGPRPEDNVALFLDGDKHNPSLANLEWAHRYGRVEHPPIDVLPPELRKSARPVGLTNSDEFAIVDAELFDWVTQAAWRLSRWGYVEATRKQGRKFGYERKTLMMHRLLANADAESQVDHINGEIRDNRRSNLRLCTHAENARNSRPYGRSGYKGTYWDGARQMWEAKIMTASKSRYLGRFKSKKEAAKAYDEAARELFGEFAYLNFGERHQRESLKRTER